MTAPVLDKLRVVRAEVSQDKAIRAGDGSEAGVKNH
jgi:hypothetical protein